MFRVVGARNLEVDMTDLGHIDSALEPLSRA